MKKSSKEIAMETNWKVVNRIKPVEPGVWTYSRIQSRIDSLQDEYVGQKQVRLALVFIAAFVLVNLSLGMVYHPEVDLAQFYQLTESNNALYP